MHTHAEAIQKPPQLPNLGPEWHDAVRGEVYCDLLLFGVGALMKSVEARLNFAAHDFEPSRSATAKAHALHIAETAVKLQCLTELLETVTVQFQGRLTELRLCCEDLTKLANEGLALADSAEPDVIAKWVSFIVPDSLAKIKVKLGNLRRALTHPVRVDQNTADTTSADSAGLETGPQSHD